MKLAALADRAENRAYDGAPPTIPHPVEALSAASCLACHGEGLKVGDRIASRISHAHMTNCTQCHVEQVADLGREQLSSACTAPAPGSGLRRAPRRRFRTTPGCGENCASCHGLVTRPGTRTTHPWLTNCTQCHAPSAALDQLDFSAPAPEPEELATRGHDGRN